MGIEYCQKVKLQGWMREGAKMGQRGRREFWVVIGLPKVRRVWLLQKKVKRVDWGLVVSAHL